MNSIWNPVIVINGLRVPVQLFSAVQKSKVSFEMIDSRDKAKIRLIKTNENTGEIVLQQFIGKGYLPESKAGLPESRDVACRVSERILVTPDLISSCVPPVSNEVVFGYFINAWDLPYIRIETFYHVLPQKNEEMNYSYVLKALKDMNTMGIAQATYQNCCNLFALAATCTDAINRVSANGRLVLYKLRFDDQISECEAPVLPQLDNEDDAVMIELKSFMTLCCDVFDLSGFRDTFNDRFLEAIAA